MRGEFGPVSPLDLITPEVLSTLSPAAQDRLLRLMERRAQLLGLGRPPLPWWTQELAEIARALAPKFVPDVMSSEHDAMYEWARDVEPGTRPRPLVVCLPRGRGKSTTVAVIVVLLGCFRRRRYCLYVSGTQKQADSNMRAIQSVLESPLIAQRFPRMSEKALTKFGQSRGWTQQRLITADGFMVESVGLVESIRGLRNDEQRPDLIVIDDADQWSDSPDTILKKIGSMTGAIMLAGSPDAATLFVGNMPNAGGLMHHVVEPRKFPVDEQFLLDRLLVGPVPAVEGLIAEQEEQEDGTLRWRIVAGKATWPERQDLAWCEAEMNKATYPTFMRELQHDTTPPAGGVFDHVRYRRCTWAEVPWPDVIDIQAWTDPALSDKDDADACAISVCAITVHGIIYLLHAFEKRSTPTAVLTEAILQIDRLEGSTVGVETNAGGDYLWEIAYNQVVEQLIEEGLIREGPQRFEEEKAPSTMSKPERARAWLLVEYEQGRIVHVVDGGAAATMEAALARFPKTKPLDLVDAHGWAVHRLRELVPIVELEVNTKADQRNDWRGPEQMPQVATGRTVRTPEPSLPAPPQVDGDGFEPMGSFLV